MPRLRELKLLRGLETDILIGKRFGRLTITGFQKNKHRQKMAVCNCICGNTKEVALYDLRTRHTTSCGCLKKKHSNKHIGQKFGRLTITGFERGGYGITVAHCNCDCGNTTTASFSQIRNGRTTSCGCLHREMASEKKFTTEEIVGTRYGRWTVVEEVEVDNNGRNFQCMCECGTTNVVAFNNLQSGRSTSCGCLSHETKNKKQKYC